MKRCAAAAVAICTASTAAWANEPNEKLLALSEPERQTVLADHVRRNGKDCDAAVRAMLLSNATSQSALWSVGCQNQKSYAVTVYADSQLRPFVVSCEDLKDYGRMMNIMERRQPQTSQVAECWKKF